ncbi:hypothetical protein BGZ63DRAFT_383453 [Mariannaea sp. PMI_226]|nr:hypothetical protein BGZ63DRAFT_383453 [Mariannaea sp. PMI_226]
MSSPDPLNDSATEAVIMPSTNHVTRSATRSVTRSARSDRFMSREGSPRKQTFELEVGDNSAPQKLLVTVETEGAAATSGLNGTRRRLFQSSSPMPTIRQRERATTTIVPLKETIEEEPMDANATPRRRGRPRKSNGTPLPTTATKRRAGTPINRTPRQRRKTKPAEENEIGEPKRQSTPKSTRRGRPPKNRKVEPSSELGFKPTQETSSIPTGPREWQDQTLSEHLETTNDSRGIPLNDDAEFPEDNEVTLITLPPSEPNEPEVPTTIAAEPRSEAESDIWMATLDDEPTPRPLRTTQSARTLSPPESDDNSSHADDFGYLAPAGSDISSADEPPSEPGPDTNDTIAQGEDFSMIFMDSLPSLRSSVQVPAEADFGDETSLIINNTLESLRESLRRSVQQHEKSSENTGDTKAHEAFLPPASSELHLMEPDHVESEQIEPTYVESDHSEIDDDEIGQAQIDNDPSAHPEGPQHGLEPTESESVDLDHFEHESMETEIIEPERMDHEHMDNELIESSPVRHEFTEVAEDRSTHFAPDTNARSPGPETNIPELLEPEMEEIRKPAFVRPPTLFSPHQNLSPRWRRSPRRGAISPLRQQLLKSQARQTDEIPSTATPEKHHEPTASSPALQETPSRINEDVSNLYEDSFSEIPGDVLEAATPHRSRAAFVEREAAEEEEEEQVEEGDRNLGNSMDETPAAEAVTEDDAEMEDIQSSQPAEDQGAAMIASNDSHISQSEGARLPTPDDTPPQIEAGADDQAKPNQESQASEGAPSQRSSSPMIASERQFQGVRDVMEVGVEDEEEMMPRAVDIPTILEPQPEEASLTGHVAWPEVTPVNQLTSPLQDPQSLVPEVLQDKVLRPPLSPIVRAGRALQSVTSDPPSPEPRENHLRSPFRSSVPRELGPPTTNAPASRRMSSSPRRPLAFPPVTQIPPPASQVYDDPFSSTTKHTGQVSFMEALERSSGRPVSRRTHESPVESSASSMHIVPPDDVQMSWIADEGPISANLRGDVPLKDLAPTQEERVSIPRQRSESREADNRGEAPQEEDDDLDIWEFEAQRATPRTTRQQPFGKRRRGLPSPWTKKPLRSPQKDLARISPGRQGRGQGTYESSVTDNAYESEQAVEEESQAEEFSLLAQKEATKETNPAPESANKANRFDLSSFFSSPAAIPGMLADKFLPASARSILGTKPNEPESETIQAAPTLPTSSMFPQVAQKEFQPRASTQTDLFSPVRPRLQEANQETPSPQRTEYEVGDEVEMASVPQKRDFTPRPRQPDPTFFKSSVRSGVPTPPRMQLSRADIERWQQETSVASEASPEEVQRPLLRPLPPKNASPVKSSLRSPLKPRTPGRVVEFTSSVLSPVEQVKARQMRRLSNSSATSQASVASKRPPPPSRTLDKENHVASSAASDATMSDASALVKSPQPEPLSKTVWTRRHWLFLDELLQLRRAGPFDLSYERRADEYLGKSVRSHGEEMTLERWHLDCVDAFKAEVGGWDEAALVKRLFALILGEAKRSRSVVKKRPARVMFH